MDKKENLIGQATTEQINAWKEQHGDIFAFKVDGHICYLRKPTRSDPPRRRQVHGRVGTFGEDHPRCGGRVGKALKATEVDPAERRDWIRKLDTQLRYYLHIDPDSLTDWEWAMRVNELLWIRKQEAEAVRQK